MEEFLHLYEMESLSLGITARKDVVDQVRRFFLGDAGASSGMFRTALAMAARHDHAENKRAGEDKEQDEEDGEQEQETTKSLRLVIAGNSKECFRNRLRNIQLVALSKAVVKSRLMGIHALDFCHNYLGEEQDDDNDGGGGGGASSTAGFYEDDDNVATVSARSVLDETPFLLDVAPSIARLLESSDLYTSGIQEINLSGNRIGPETCKLLCGALSENTTPLKRLDLSGNPLGVAGGHAIAELLHSATPCKLEELNIGNTEIQVENLIAIATALRENRTLTVLNLDNPVIRTKEEEAIQHIGKMLQVNDTLRVLSLNKHHLTDQGAQVLAERLLDNHTLQRLTLRANSIGATGASALAALLLRHDALSEFDLSANRIGDAGARAFATLLRHNTRPLATLALCSTYLTDDGLAAIAQACLQPRHPQTNNLRSLLLWGNDFGDRAAQLFWQLHGHGGRFADWDVETDFLPIPSDEEKDGVAASIQIAHRDVRHAAAFASPKR